MATSKKAAAENYSADDIKHLSPRDALRKKTAMYIGSTDAHGLFTCVREVADNILDEALAGYCTAGTIVAKSGTEFWMHDNGRGMPTGMMEIEDPVSGTKSKIPALQAITSLLHAGGKIDATNSAYKASRGCFTGDTKIKFPNGDSITMSSLYKYWNENTPRHFDIIILDRDTKKLVISRVIDVILSKYVDSITRVYTQYGGYVDCTPDHKFYVNSEDGIVSVAAADLKPGTRLVTSFVDTEYKANLMGTKLMYTEQGSKVELTYDSSQGRLSSVSSRGVAIDDVKVAFVESITLAAPVPVFDLTIDHPSHNFFVQLAGTHDSDRETHVLVSNSHAIGQKATNFLSEYFKVTTFSASTKGAEKQWHSIEYLDGKLSSPMKKCKPPVNPLTNEAVKKGTVVEFKLNTSFFTDKSFSPSLLVEYLKIASYFTPGFKWTLSSASGKSKVFHSERGVLDYLDDYKESLKEVSSLKEGNILQASSGLFDVALDFTNADGSHLKGFTNGLLNSEGGTHVNATLQALLKSITPFAKKNQVFSSTELREGLVGLINVKLSAPRFTSQVKVRLDDERADAPLRDSLIEEFSKFFKKNKSLAELICERCTKLKELKSKFLASKAVVTAINKTKAKGFPAKALAAPNCKPEQRELYIVEGDSAKGPVTAERDAFYQEALPIRGKIMNAHRATPAKFFSSDEVIDLLAMIGFDPKSPDPLGKLRVNKLIFLTDADSDGFHIAVLLLSMIHKYLPDLIDRGMVYVADIPEYMAEVKGKPVYGDSKIELQEKLQKLGAPKATIHHFKGLGEMESPMLKAMALDPQTRRLRRVTRSTVDNADSQFVATVSGDASTRRTLLGI